MKIIIAIAMSLVTISAFALNHQKVFLFVKLPKSYDTNCAYPGKTSFNYVDILLANGKKVHARINPLSRKGCIYEATAITAKRNIGQSSNPGDVTISTGEKGIFYPECSSTKVVTLKNGEMINLSTGGTADCPEHCTNYPPRPCGN